MKIFSTDILNDRNIYGDNGRNIYGDNIATKKNDYVIIPETICDVLFC